MSASMKVGTLALAGLAGAAGQLLMAWGAQAAVLKADYRFDNSFASSVAGAPNLTPVDPLGSSSFGTDTVFGTNASVYNFAGGNLPASSQGGFAFDNSAGLLTSNSYSVDVSFKFNERSGAWRRIIDVQDRASDAGFYVDPSNNLDIYPQSGSSSPFTTGQYYDVVLTVGNGTATAYLNGVLQFSYVTTIMDISNADNPRNLVNFFLDNTQGGGQGEWSSGSIARLALYDGALTAGEIRTNFDTPLPPVVTPPATAVPEPGSALLLISATAMLLGTSRRKRAAPDVAA